MNPELINLLTALRPLVFALQHQSQDGTVSVTDANGLIRDLYAAGTNNDDDEPLTLRHLADIVEAAEPLARLMEEAARAPTAQPEPPTQPLPTAAQRPVGRESDILSMRLRDILRVNIERCYRWHPGGPNEWTASQWLLATMGELGELAAKIMPPASDENYYAVRSVAALGEACNAMKKLWRVRSGMANKSADQKRQISDEASAKGLIVNNLSDLLYSIPAIGYAVGLDMTPIAAPYFGYGPDGSNEEQAKEWADTFLYLMLTAARLNIDPDAAIIEVFNSTSERYGFPERLPSSGVEAA